MVLVMQSEKRGVKIDPTLGLQGLMYITAAIADEHLAIRERTSSPFLLLYIRLNYILQCTYRSYCLRRNALTPLRYFEIF